MISYVIMKFLLRYLNYCDIFLRYHETFFKVFKFVGYKKQKFNCNFTKLRAQLFTDLMIFNFD